jgi:hypothetical protein
MDDKNRPFEDIFYDVMWTCIRDLGISLGIVQADKFRDSCKKGAKRLEMKMGQNTLEICRKLQEATKAGFDGVQRDMKILEKRIKGECPGKCKEEE